jgi:zona occludens toxin
MINLITGLPGNGKTLYAIAYVKDWSEREKRPVFYAGIKDLKLDWTEIDPAKWFECPPGAIIVIDECQTLFRPRTISKEVPDYVSKLETHRHQGVDLVLITQHPMLADTALRRLAGNHKHVVRKFGTQSATIHEWYSVKDNCDKKAGRADSNKHHWVFPKSIYEFYKSAEVHTVKRNIPKKIYFLALAPLFIIFVIFYMYKFIDRRAHPDQNKQTSSGQIIPNPSFVRNEGGNAKSSYKDAVSDAKQFVFERTPRVNGLAYTSPRYDELTKPDAVPVPAACIKSSRGCNCYTQQATPLIVEKSFCENVVAHGFFEDFPREKNKSNEGQMVRPYVNGEAVSPQPVQKPVVVSLGDADGYGVLGNRGEGVRVPGAEVPKASQADGGGDAPPSGHRPFKKS